MREAFRCGKDHGFCTKIQVGKAAEKHSGDMRNIKSVSNYAWRTTVDRTSIHHYKKLYFWRVLSISLRDIKSEKLFFEEAS